jgi:hypothetical protein
MFTDTFDIGVTFRSMVSVVPANTSDPNPTTITNPNNIAILFISFHLLPLRFVSVGDLPAHRLAGVATRSSLFVGTATLLSL